MDTELQDRLFTLLDGPPGRAHLMGVCGVGVAGVAQLLAARGWEVDGCDAAPDSLLGNWLAGCGIAVAAGHDASHVAQPGPAGRPAMLVHSAAVPADHAEILRARAAGWTVCRRGEALAALVDGSRGVAVCGAHGKTTTTCFTTRLLQELGAAPSWCIGGQTATLGGVAGIGEGKLLVVEADESDGTLARYHPAVIVVNNIDLDHLEHFDGPEALVACYRQAVLQTREAVAFGADDARARLVASAWHGPAIGFGFCAESDLRAVAVETTAEDVAFDVIWRGAKLGRVTLAVPGRHNVLNALGALAAVVLLGHELRLALAALPRVAELPGRRFERVVASGAIRVISDYAHHPAEIAVLVAAARQQGAQRVVAVFQPHRYSRTKALGMAFPAAFDGVDELVLCPVYAASETPLEGGESADLYGQFRTLRPEQAIHLARSLAEAWQGVRRMLREGDLLLVVGAGDVAQIATWATEAVAARAWGAATPLPARSGAGEPTVATAAAALAAITGVTLRRDRPLAECLLYGVGGAADVLADAATPAALAGVLAWGASHGVPVHVLGGGANTWASDLGVAGIVVRLRGAGMRGFVRRGTEVDVGCGWNGPALLDRLEQEGLAGLECLDSVPGQVGGWLAMNAGAHGGAIGSCVVRIRCLNGSGGDAIVEPHAADFGYRRCGALADRLAWQVTLRLTDGAPAEIRERRLAYRAQRTQLAGLRTAGSVFCNPAGDFAGRLLEAAGCKTLRVGGATVYAQHANVIVAGAAATASDVLALMLQMQRRVLTRFGVLLALENRLLGLGD